MKRGSSPWTFASWSCRRTGPWASVPKSTFETARKTGVTVLPAQYILWRDEKPGVFVRQGQHAALARPDARTQRQGSRRSGGWPGAGGLGRGSRRWQDVRPSKVGGFRRHEPRCQRHSTQPRPLCPDRSWASACCLMIVMGMGGHLPRLDRRRDPAGRADRRRFVGRPTRHPRSFCRGFAGAKNARLPGAGRARRGVGPRVRLPYHPAATSTASPCGCPSWGSVGRWTRASGCR